MIEACSSETDVASMRIRHNSSAGIGMDADECAKRRGLGILDHRSPNFAGFRANTDNGSLAYRSATGSKLLVRMLVLLATTNIGFIDLDMIAHAATLFSQPSFADALSKEPS